MTITTVLIRTLYNYVCSILLHSQQLPLQYITLLCIVQLAAILRYAYKSRNSPSYRQSINVLLRINSYSRIVVVHHGAQHNCKLITIKDAEFQPIRSRKNCRILAKIRLAYKDFVGDTKCDIVTLTHKMGDKILCLSRGEVTLFLFPVIMYTLYIIIMCYITRRQYKEDRLGI